MPDTDQIRVRIVYALADRQSVVDLSVPAGTSVADAVGRSGLLKRFPAIAQQPLNCAIFGRAVLLNDGVHDGDRIEILRPLLIDPKENRRQAAARSRSSSRQPQ